MSPHSSNRVALLLSPRLGDSLLLMTIANNLRRAGRSPIVYGSHAVALADWFPGFDIRPVPTPQEMPAVARDTRLVQMHDNMPIAALAAQCPGFVSIKAWLETNGWRDDAPAPNSILAKFRSFSKEVLGVDDWTHDNGFRAPAGLRARAQSRRVILHPTASEPERCWAPSQYASLALRLRQRGLEPVFVLAPAERPAWRPVLDPHGFPILESPDLAGIAATIYESGWFIGSDSGIGHLASACGVPTITIVERPRNMSSWRPAWAPSLVVRPWWLPLRGMRRKYWRAATTVGRVLATFEQMRRAIAQGRQAEKLRGAAGAGYAGEDPTPT